MSQADFTIADQDGASFLVDINAQLAAIVSQSSGATEPATTYAYQYWADTSAGILKRRNAANSAWVDEIDLATGAPVVLADDTGSSLVNFLQAGTGAVARTVQAKLRETISVKDFGAVGDGVADDTLEIQAAIDYAESIGAAVHAPAGRYLVSSLTIPENMRFYGDGMGVTTFVQTGSAIAFFIITGSIGASKALTANADAGDNTLDFDTTGLVAGDWILLADTFSYNTLDANYKSGELLQVKTVNSAAQVTTYQTVSGSMIAGNAYTTANASYIRKLSFAKDITLEDFSFEGDITTTTYFCLGTYTQNLLINRIGFKDVGNSALYIRTSQGLSITNCVGTDILDDQPNSHSGYAIALGYACSDVVIANNIIERCRHGFTTLGGTEGIAHNVLVSGNIFTNTSIAAIDTHACGAGIVIDGNTVNYAGASGITIRSKRTVVSNNYIRSPVSHGISCGELHLSDIKILNNVISKPLVHGITCADPCPNLVIDGNVLTDVGYDGIYLFNTATTASPGLVVTNNKVLGVSLVVVNRSGILVTSSAGSSTGAVIKNNMVDAGSGTPQFGVRLLALTGSIATDNQCLGTFSSSAFNIVPTVRETRNDLIGSGNILTLDSVATGGGLSIVASGDDANIDIAITPKGTGRVKFGTLTANADAPITGYITVRDSGGTLRKLAVIA